MIYLKLLLRGFVGRLVIVMFLVDKHWRHFRSHVGNHSCVTFLQLVKELPNEWSKEKNYKIIDQNGKGTSKLMLLWLRFRMKSCIKVKRLLTIERSHSIWSSGYPHFLPTTIPPRGRAIIALSLFQFDVKTKRLSMLRCIFGIFPL